MDSFILILQALATAYLAGWITTGVKDNIQLPEINREAVSAVMRMDRLAELYPNEYAQMAHRRITDPARHRLIFRFIVVCELVAAALLWLGVVGLVSAAFGVTDPVIARIAALIGILAFTAVWAGFLVAGNHFGYWLAHEWAQNAHFQLVIWGIATMVLVILPIM